MTYEERLENFKGYIKVVVARTREQLSFLTVDEIEQELMLALWRCHDKYPDRDEKHFQHTFSNAVSSAIRDLLRKHKREKTVPLNDDGGSTSSVMGVEFFKNSIKDLINGVSPESVVMILDSLDPNFEPKPKKNWKDKKASAACKREIRKFVYGN
jgi:DNA-directed RNA polymerase specialized sigma24 family protein